MTILVQSNELGALVKVFQTDNQMLKMKLKKLSKNINFSGRCNTWIGAWYAGILCLRLLQSFHRLRFQEQLNIFSLLYSVHALMT